MNYRVIDKETYYRKGVFRHFTEDCKCSTSMTARAGGDTKMGAYTDAMITIFVMLPLLFGLGLLTDIGPVELYLCIKLIDLAKVVIFHFWLKKERWLRNLTVEA